MGVLAIGIDYHIVFRSLARSGNQAGNIHSNVAFSPIGDAAHIPSVALASGSDDIFAHLALQHNSLIPHRGEGRHKTGVIGFLLVIGRGIAKHIQGRLQHHIERQLMATGALAHGLTPAGAVAAFCSVVHGTLGVVHRSRCLTDERNLGVVLHLIPCCGSPFQLLQSCHTLEVEHIGISSVESCGLESTVEVDQQVILGTHVGGTLVELSDNLVVAIHEINLEALDAYLAVVLAHMLHIAVEGVVACPQNQPHIPCLGILHQHGQVDVRHHLEEVGLTVHCPTFVEDDILNAVLGGEINIILVGIVVDACFEVHAGEVPVIPPVPCHLAGLNPAKVLYLAGLAQKIAQVVHSQVGTVLGHHGNAPGQDGELVHLGDIVLAFLYEHLQVVVATLLKGFGIAGMLALQSYPGRGVASWSGVGSEIEARIVYQCRLCEAHLHSM